MVALSGQTPWVVTREAPEGPRLCEALVSRGIPAVHMAAIERTPLPWPAALGAASVDDIWFFTSAFAAWSALRGGHVPPGARIAAIAPATVRVVEEHGRTALVRAKGGAVALARALCADPTVLRAHDDKRRPRVLYPTSDAGLGQPEQHEAIAALQERFEVLRGAAYSTRPAPRFADEVATLPGRALRAVVYSPSAARAVADAVTASGTEVRDIVAVGASTAAALPFPSRLVPGGADVVEFIASSTTHP